MRFRYSAQAASAHAGSLWLTARTRSLGTRLGAELGFRLPFRLGLCLRRRLHADRLAAPDLLQVVEVACCRMHDVHDDIAEVDEDPLAAGFALDAAGRRTELTELVP